MRKVKLGVVGLGYIGSHHVQSVSELECAQLAGVCDIVKDKADDFARRYNTKAYYSHSALFRDADIDAVIVSVPHYGHTPISIDAFESGLHVLCEKPLAVHVNDAERMIGAYRKALERSPGLVFGIMFMERLYPWYRKIKEILDGGELGRLTRVTWINTAWFRTQAYYNSGGWRATWAGEGGGLLTNQCPHNLDMYQWLFGLPEKVTGYASIGKYHDIEVEDEVTAFFEHRGGMVGHFIATTAEAPGTNRLEIVGENGKLVYEDNQLSYTKNDMSMLKLLRESGENFARMGSSTAAVPLGEKPANPHKAVTEAFVKKIMGGEGALVADGTDGINPVAIANAIMLSAFQARPVLLPMDGGEYESILKELSKTSRYKGQ